MRSLVLASLLLFSLHARADCAGTGMYFWPERGLALESATIVITGYALTQPVILELGKTYPVALVCGKERIAMLVKELHVGQFQLTQAILTAQAPLIKGHLYTLSIPGLPDARSFLRTYNRKQSGWDPVQWVAGTGISTELPRWTGAPKFTGKTYQAFGCGPAAYVTFSLPVSARSEYLIRTTVTSVLTGTSRTYCVAPDTDRVQLGHGMCSGAFAFTEDGGYTARFDLMTLSGELVPGSGTAIAFTAPTPADSAP